MKQISLSLLFCMVLAMFTACSTQSPPTDASGEDTAELPAVEETIPVQTELEEGELEPEDDLPEDTALTVLVAYFSQYAFLADNARAADGISSASIAPGDVERIAGMIRDATEADLFQIIAAEPYPADYDETAARAMEEMGTRPKLAEMVEDMGSYDVVFVGYPLWAGTYPMPVATFLESHDFADKVIVPFCTYENYIADDVWEQVESLVPESELMEGYAISLLNGNRPTVEGIEVWLDQLGLLDDKQGGGE